MAAETFRVPDSAHAAEETPMADIRVAAGAYPALFKVGQRLFLARMQKPRHMKRRLQNKKSTVSVTSMHIDPDLSLTRTHPPIMPFRFLPNIHPILQSEALAGESPARELFILVYSNALNCIFTTALGVL